MGVGFTEKIQMTKYQKSYNVILDNMDLAQYRLRPISAIMYLQDAFARFMAAKNMAAYDLFPQNIYWVVGEFNIDFVDLLPFWSEEIKIEIWISELSKLKIYTDFNIYYKGKIFAKGNACWFLINMETRRPVKVDTFADKLPLCSEYTLGEHQKFLCPEPQEKIGEIKHVINLSDLDFNKHVNNKSYINLAEMTLSEEFKKAHNIRRLNVRFNRETFLGDVLDCVTYKTDNDNIYVHKIEKDGVSVCDVMSSWEKAKDCVDILNYDMKVKHELETQLV